MRWLILPLCFVIFACSLSTTCNTDALSPDGENGTVGDYVREADVEQGEIYVAVYDSEQTCEGTTFLPDLHDSQRPRIVEVNMRGEVVWEYIIPDALKQYINPGLDVEVLSSGNILFVLPRNGVYEIDSSGTVVWSYLDTKVSHDADRLSNGNTLIVWGEAMRRRMLRQKR